jgi:hypothetical protein
MSPSHAKPCAGIATPPRRPTQTANPFTLIPAGGVGPAAPFVFDLVQQVTTLPADDLETIHDSRRTRLVQVGVDHQQAVPSAGGVGQLNDQVEHGAGILPAEEFTTTAW